MICMENRFHRDLKLLMQIGTAAAALIAGGGYLVLRGLRWEESPEVLRELLYWLAGGVGVLAVAGLWVWRVARRLRRPPPSGGG